MTRGSFIFFAKNGGFGGSYNLNKAVNLCSQKYKSKLIVQAKSPYAFGNGIMVSDFKKVDSIISGSNNLFICDYQGLIPICSYLSKKYNKKITHNIGDKDGVKFLLDFLKDRNVIFFWSGTKYLNNSSTINKWAKIVGAKVTFAMPDLIRCDPKALPLYQPFDIKQKKDKFKTFTLCHSPGKKIIYPKGPNGKGTYYIERAFLKMREKYGVDYHILVDSPHAEALNIKQRSHIFVDQLMPNIGGIGKSSLESLILGTPVLSDIHNCVFKGAYTGCPVVNVEDEKQLFKKLEELHSSSAKLKKLAKESQNWASVLSLENTAAYLDKEIMW